MPQCTQIHVSRPYYWKLKRNDIAEENIHYAPKQGVQKRTCSLIFYLTDVKFYTCTRTNILISFRFEFIFINKLLDVCPL